MVLKQLSLSCKSLRVGSYEFHPMYKVVFSGENIRLMVPSVKEQDKLVTIIIGHNDIIRMMANFDEKHSLVFLHLKADACKNIREALKMKKKKHHFLDVKSSKECQKRICLVPNFMAAKCAGLLRSYFGNLLQEIDAGMAREIYALSKPALEISNINDASPVKGNTRDDYTGSETKGDCLDVRKNVEDYFSSNELQKLIYRKEIKRFNFAVAEIVKTCMSFYYKPRKINPKMYQITSKAEYSNLAKMFSHKFREEISKQYFDKKFSFEGIRLTKDDELKIKTRIEIELHNRLKIGQAELVGYSV